MHLSRVLVVGLLAVGVGACMTAEEFRADADEEVYALIDSRREALFGEAGEFKVEPPTGSLRDRLLTGEVGQLEPLTLVDCLEIAAENNRDYQTRRERLYQVALNLTLERWRFSNQFGVTSRGTITGTGEEAERAQVDGDVQLSRLLGTGATIVADIGSSLFRFLSTGDGWDAISSLGLSITQPLMQGAGRRIVREPLTQAERDLVYEVRSLERFRRTFSVDVASRYYNLLFTMDNMSNEEANSSSLGLLRARNEAMSKAGRLDDIQVDQARQNELRSLNRLLQLEQSLQGQLDDFKLFLGLPIATPLELAPGELQRLRDTLGDGDALLEDLIEARVVDVALDNRLDFLTNLDQLQDTERRVRVSANALEMGLDLGVSVNGTSEEGRPASFRENRIPWSASLAIDLPTNRIPERNAYRRAMITYQATHRSVVEFADTIQANLRDQLRVARTALASYKLQLNAVTLAERRVESAKLKLEAGRADTRDLLESQDALVGNQNSVTRALIDFALSRLRLYLEMELLTIDENGISLDNETLASLSALEE